MSYHYSIKKAMDDSSLRLKRERERDRDRERQRQRQRQTERERERERERETSDVSNMTGKIYFHLCSETPSANSNSVSIFKLLKVS